MVLYFNYNFIPDLRNTAQDGDSYFKCQISLYDVRHCTCVFFSVLPAVYRLALFLSLIDGITERDRKWGVREKKNDMVQRATGGFEPGPCAAR